MTRRRSLVFLMVGCLVLFGCFSPPVITPTEVAYCAKRITYATVDGADVKLDVFWPAGDGPFPMVVNFHGGAWWKNNQEGFSEPMCRWLTNQGYTVFNVSYRLAPQFTFPAQIKDALGAMIYTKENAANYNGDPNRVAVMGDSAGGNIAAMVALCWNDPSFKPSYPGNGKVTAEPQAAVLLFPVLDLVNMYNMFGPYVIFENPKEIAQIYLGGPMEKMLDLYRDASPMFRIHRGMPPTLLVCGVDDPLLPQTKRFKNKLDDLGVPNGVYIATGETHGFTAFPFNKGAVDAYNVVRAFLDLELRHLRPRAAAPDPASGKKEPQGASAGVSREEKR